MRRYNPKEIEPKWQKTWAKSKIYHADDSSTKPKRYVLEYFPYPSGAAMHVGHVRNYTIGDVVSRSLRMQGFNVLHPMGWDAFGLPAENYAIKSNISPQKAVADNVAHFKQQLMQMGFSYDWSREINSTDPEYYKWTQWFFIFLFNKGLAYQKESLQWWCEHDKTVLANEQVEDGKCWRCGNPVVKKALEQWFFKITDYADRLEADLEKLDWSEAIKAMQRNWIGKSLGAEIDFEIEGSDEKLKIFTTRPDTIFGATFMVVAPEHNILSKLNISDEVARYIASAQRKSAIDRMDTGREITGVNSGLQAINPANGGKIPIWVADYVLPDYGTGAIMAVPAHDERDHAFAEKFSLPVVEVVNSVNNSGKIYIGEGTLINSGEFNDMATTEAREKIVASLADMGVALEKTNYKIHDWLISRQRYWGAPIPIIHCQKCGSVPVPDDQLPVELPLTPDYLPTGDGQSPLAKIVSFINVNCPKCKGPGLRETDTMDGFACSSWYFLRFADPDNNKEAFSPDKVKNWLPVDDYIGGAEHAVMHLLYARFWTKVMFDAGLINFDEPFISLRNQGMILAPDGQKMSKSKNNTIEPDGLLQQGYGADSIRLMELFIGPWDQSASWSTEGLAGMYRFLQRVWVLVGEFSESPNSEVTNEKDSEDIRRATDKTAKKVTHDIQNLNFNTAIAAMMECVNELYKIKATSGIYKDGPWNESLSKLVQLLAPFVPHIAEELWQEMGNKTSIHITDWPKWDNKLIVDSTAKIAVQVNGKVRAEILIPANADENNVISKAKANPKVAKYLNGKKIQRQVYVPDRLVSFATE